MVKRAKRSTEQLICLNRFVCKCQTSCNIVTRLEPSPHTDVSIHVLENMAVRGRSGACHKLKLVRYDCWKFFWKHRFVHCVVLCPVFTSYLSDRYRVLSLSCWLHILLVFWFHIKRFFRWSLGPFKSYHCWLTCNNLKNKPRKFN